MRHFCALRRLTLRDLRRYIGCFVVSGNPMRFLLIAALCIGSAGYGDERTDAQKHYVKGTKAFDLGAYDEAIAEYSAAYRIKDDPALLYNLGQAHRLANHPLDAIHFYRMYLTKVPDAPNRDEVASKLADLQREVDRQRAAEQRKADEQQRAAAAERAANNSAHVSVTAPTAPPDGAVTQAAPQPTNRKLMIAGATGVGIGVAALAGGLACGVLARQSSDDLTRAGQTMQPFDSSKQSAGKTEQAAEIALLAVGGVVAVTGIVLLVVGRTHSHRFAHAQSAPTVGASLGGVAAVQF
jgi:tetratricopeptide (TPR) repeat protein